MPDQTPTSPNVLTYLDARIPVRFHEHLGVVHGDGASAERGAEYLSEGLRLGQWCCCVAPAAMHAGILARLGDLGVDVRQHLNDHTLQLPPAAQGPGELMEWANRFFAHAETARAPAVRWWEEGVWARAEDHSAPEFFAAHSRLNYLVKHYPSAAVCQYDSADLDIPHLFSAIAVHRHLMVEGTLVRDNPFYIPPEKFLAMTPEDRERDLQKIFREVGFDWKKLCASLAGYGQIQRPAPPRS